MKNTIYSILALLLILSFSSCEKEIPTYDGVDGLYFDVQWGAAHGDFSLWSHQIYTPVEFGKYGITDSTVLIKVMAVGFTKSIDRPFTVVIDPNTTNAVEGVDYTDFNGNGVIKAGEDCGYVSVKIYRTERMKNETVRLTMKLQENEFFTLPFTSFGEVPGRWEDTRTDFMKDTDPRFFNVFATDILSMPEKWFGSETGGLWGPWTSKKYRLLMELTETSPEDYTTIDMPSARANVMNEIILDYLNKNMSNGTPILEDDGTYMWVMNVTWSIGDKPE